MILIAEQMLNGLQLSAMLFLLAAGLTLTFGIMGIINLAHGSLYMIGAYTAAYAALATGSFAVAAVAALLVTGVLGILVEFGVMRRLYARNHLDQVLATFALILISNQAVILLFGRQPVFVQMPVWLAGSVELLPGLSYSYFRLAVICVGVLVALALHGLLTRTRIGMLIRAGATHRDMVRALGVDIKLIYTLVFGLGATLAALAGIVAGPIYSVQVGMGEQILIMTFVVVVIGGVGSVTGAMVGALVVGMTDTVIRAFAPTFLKLMLPASEANALGAALSSMGIYLLMAIVLLLRPRGLMQARG